MQVILTNHNKAEHWITLEICKIELSFQITIQLTKKIS